MLLSVFTKHFYIIRLGDPDSTEEYITGRNAKLQEEYLGGKLPIRKFKLLSCSINNQVLAIPFDHSANYESASG